MPIEELDGFRAALSVNRARFYLDVKASPFCGFNRAGATVSQRDLTDHLKAIEVPVLLMPGTDKEIVPITSSAVLSQRLVKNGPFENDAGFLRGMRTTHVNAVDCHRWPSSGTDRSFPPSPYCER